jgi:OmpR-family two-component system manganese-sensing response regulator
MLLCARASIRFPVATGNILTNFLALCHCLEAAVNLLSNPVHPDKLLKAGQGYNLWVAGCAKTVTAATLEGLMAKILLVEDDPLVAEAVQDALGAAKHIIDWTRDGKEGRDRLLLYQYDMAILDWMLPGVTGTQICRDYRARGGLIPVLMLTGKTNLSEKMEGFDAGADDYLTKPFQMAELNARVRALLRRPTQIFPDLLEIGDLSLDPKRSTVKRAGREIPLLAKELAVLDFLMRHKGQFFTIADLLNHVWSSESESSEEAVRQCILRLRRKIDLEGEKSLIVTVKGLGYKIDDQ